MSLVESFSGIRGIYNKDFDKDDAVKYAYSFLNLIKKLSKKNNPTIVIGMDTRPSNKEIIDSIIAILDCNFINVSVSSTPCTEFCVRHFNADGGIMITASHNEPEWSGFKFLGKNGAILNPNEMKQVIDNKNYLKNFVKISQRKVLERNNEAVEEYSKFLLSIIGKESSRNIKNSRQKILIDPNGGTGVIAKHVLDKIGVSYSSINMEVSKFARKVEPTQESLSYLKDEIKKNSCDFAVGFDCDADRAEIMLKDGKIISGNEILALIVDYYLSKSGKRETVVVNDATSAAVKEICEKYMAKLVETEVGETNVVTMMDKSKSIIGGEGSSGGVIVPPSKCRDGILSMLLVLAICAEKGKKIEELILELPKYFNLRAKKEFDAKNHDSIKKKLKEYYSKNKFEIRETSGIKGGLKCIKGKSSIWFRASKTEGSVFRIISDSSDKKEAEKLLEEAVLLFDKLNE